MAGDNRKKNWQQYYASSREKAEAEVGDAENDSEKKIDAAGFFEDAQTFDDISIAVGLVGEIADGSKTHTAQELEALLAEAKKAEKPDFDKIPEVFGLREAVIRARKAIDLQNYQNNLENLSEGLKTLLETDDINKLCPSLEREKTKSPQERKEALDRELYRFKKLKNFYGTDAKGDPNDGNQVPKEIETVAKRAVEILEAFRAEGFSIIDNEDDRVKNFKVKKDKDFRKKVRQAQKRISTLLKIFAKK